MSHSGVGRLAFALVLFFVAQGGRCQPTKAVDSFQLVFADSTTKKVQVRYLERSSGQWKSGQPPNVAADGGMGSASTESGMMSIAGWTADTALSFAWGLGAVYDNRADETTGKPALSATSIVGAPSNTDWLFAYRTVGDIVAVKHFNYDTHSFTDIDYAPTEANAQNGSVSGRPALARLGQTVALAWQRGSELRFAVGTCDNKGIPTWTHKFGLTLPSQVDGDCYGAPTSPVLAAAAGRFYLAVRRSTVRCGGYEGVFLSRDDLFLFASPDGRTWQPTQPVAMRANVNIPLGELALAGWTDGTLLLGLVTSQVGKFQLLKYRNGWSELDAQAIFGVTPLPAPVSIHATKMIMDKDAAVAPF